MATTLPSSSGEADRLKGDSLYAKADYAGAIEAYINTIGTVQPSYVIRKFLDGQTLTHLTRYLQQLHEKSLANSDHTTLLLNCYTKLGDDAALTSFLHSAESAEEPPFDLETAIRVCRQAGYFEHAVWLAERYGAHADFLRIQIEDMGDVSAALRYLRTLAVDVAEHNLLRYGQTLLARDAQGTTELLIDLCCGDLTKVIAPRVITNGENGANANGLGYLNYLAYATSPDGVVQPPPASNHSSPRPDRKTHASPTFPQPPSPAEPSAIERAQASPSPGQFFAHFVDHPIQFITFLETVAERRFGKKIKKSSPQTKTALPAVGGLRLTEVGEGAEREEQAVWNTLLELYLSTDPAAGSTSETAKAKVTKEELESKALDLLRSRESIAYDDTQALLVCTTRGFTPGFVLLYEQLGMYDDIVRYWIDEAQLAPQSREASSQVLVALGRYGLQKRAYLYRLVLRFLSSSDDLLSRHALELNELLTEIETHQILNPIAVVQILSASGLASVGVVREYLKRQLAQEQQETDSDAALIASYRTESASLSAKIADLSSQTKPQIFQATRCSACAGQLKLPAVHFLCQHSYHERCLTEGSDECPQCHERHELVSEVRKAGEGWLTRSEEWREDVKDAAKEGEGWNKVAESFGWGLMRAEE